MAISSSDQGTLLLIPILTSNSSSAINAVNTNNSTSLYWLKQGSVP